MNKRGWLALILAVCLLALTACQSANNSEPFQVVTSVNQLPQQNVTVPDPPALADTVTYDFDSGDYDPASEEDPNAEDEWQELTFESTVSSVPTPAPIRIVSAAIIRVVPDPCITRLKISRPNLSVPKRCAREGPWSLAELILVGG